jgi:hypothetical protein
LNFAKRLGRGRHRSNLATFRASVKGPSQRPMGSGHKTAYTQNERPVETIILLEGINQHKFGTPLTAIEKAWLMGRDQRIY